MDQSKTELGIKREAKMCAYNELVCTTDGYEWRKAVFYCRSRMRMTVVGKGPGGKMSNLIDDDNR